MDRQVVDRDGLMVCKVDDVELTEHPDGSWEVTGLLAGPPALVPRFGGRLGRRLEESWRRLGLQESNRLVPWRIALALVDELGSGVTLLAAREGLLERQTDSPPAARRRTPPPQRRAPARRSGVRRASAWARCSTSASTPCAANPSSWSPKAGRRPRPSRRLPGLRPRRQAGPLAAQPAGTPHPPALRLRADGRRRPGRLGRADGSHPGPLAAARPPLTTAQPSWTTPRTWWAMLPGGATSLTRDSSRSASARTRTPELPR